MIYDNLTVYVFDKARNDHIQGGYKYLIRGRGSIGKEAYKTDEGFKFFLESRNLDLELIRENKKVKTYKVIGQIEERLFWSLSDVSSEAECFKGLSNGKYVDCYYLHTEKGSIIYRPNSNSKEVYNPLSLDDHLKFQEKYG